MTVFEGAIRQAQRLGRMLDRAHVGSEFGLKGQELSDALEELIRQLKLAKTQQSYNDRADAAEAALGQCRRIFSDENPESADNQTLATLKEKQERLSAACQALAEDHRR